MPTTTDIDIDDLLFGVQKCRENGEEIDLSRADLSRADLSRADLSRADLSRADLFGADLFGANLSGANLSGANLSGADLSRAYLSWANLTRANLSGANLFGADLFEANLSGTGVSRIYGHPWEITVYPESLAIGCERHTIAEWEKFSDSQIEGMEPRALNWWKRWKTLILATAKTFRDQ